MVKISDFDNFGVEDLNDKEFAERQKYVLGKCKCPTCPTYVKGDAPYGYCYPPIGTSSVIKHEKSCVCLTCPVYKEYELTHTFYCTRCSQVCQAFKAEAGGGHE